MESVASAQLKVEEVETLGWLDGWMAPGLPGALPVKHVLSQTFTAKHLVIYMVMRTFLPWAEYHGWTWPTCLIQSALTLLDRAEDT